MDLEECAAATALILLKLKDQHNMKKKNQRKRRSCKVRIINRNRLKHGFFRQYFLPVKNKDTQQFFKYTRMTVEVFNDLLVLITPLIEKKPSFHPITPEERLAVTLHYLSQGSSMQTIAWTYHLGLTTVHCIIKETLDAICLLLEEKYLKYPQTSEEWEAIADGFFQKWNFPHCIGALDGKHIAMKAPRNSGSLYFNYKKTHSIVLMAACDHDYVFTVVDVGAFGSASDGGIWQDCVFGQNFNNNMMNVPEPKRISGVKFNVAINYCFVADAAFPLTDYIMRPYPGVQLPEVQENFNYRLSRARRIIENAFGILSARWRILLNTIVADVEMVESITKTTVILHNYLKINMPARYCPPKYVDYDGLENGQWRKELLPKQMLKSVSKLGSNNYATNVRAVRDALSIFLFTECKIKN